MPELPDVEGFRRVAARAAGGRVREVVVTDAGVLRATTGAHFRRAVRGYALGTARRHGKWLGLPLRPPGKRHRFDQPLVAFHFGMTGSLAWCGHGEERHRHDRVVLVTDKGELRYRDMRKLKGISLLATDGEWHDLVEQLGPDAADLSRDEFAELLHRRRGGIKSTLMDQAVIAGLGNLTVDEILWRARVDPNTRVGDLRSRDVARIHQGTGRVLRSAFELGYVPGRRSWLTGRRDDPDGGRCPRCDTPLRHSKVGGRATVLCPHCQAP